MYPAQVEKKYQEDEEEDDEEGDQEYKIDKLERNNSEPYSIFGGSRKNKFKLRRRSISRKKKLNNFKIISLKKKYPKKKKSIKKKYINN